MVKSMTVSSAAIALALAWVLPPLCAQDAVAQSGPLSINVVNLDIVPADLDKFKAAVTANGAVAVKEAGCSEFNISVSSKDPSHVFLFEVWDSAAALDAYRATDQFKNFSATTKDMVAERNIKTFSPVSLNGSSPAQAGLVTNAIDFDILPAQFDAFIAAAKVNGAATPKDPGSREFDIMVAQNDPHHLMFYEVYDNAAAQDVHRATDHYKTYQAATKDMVAARSINPLTSVAMNRKSM